MCIRKLKKLYENLTLRKQDKKVETRIHEQLEEQEYFDSTEPNIMFKIDEKERDKVIKLIEFKFGYIAFLLLFFGFFDLDLRNSFKIEFSYKFIILLFIFLSSFYIILNVLLIFVSNREVNDLIINKSYLLIVIEIIASIILVIGILAEQEFFISLLMSIFSILPVSMGSYILFSSTRLKKSKNKKNENKKTH